MRIKKKQSYIIYIIVFVLVLAWSKYIGGDERTERTLDNVDYYVKVVKVSDGDTFIGLTDDKERVRFRMQGIDAPESKQAYSKKSTDKLSELIFGKEVGIEIHTKSDRYGRPVVYVYTLDGTDVCAEMIRSGMAWHYKQYDKSEHYSSLEKEARRNKAGLWQDANPTPPWEYRNNNRN